MGGILMQELAGQTSPGNKGLQQWQLRSSQAQHGSTRCLPSQAVVDLA
jgi:hypothetical protein